MATVTTMSWAFWLAVPLVVTAGTAALSWWRGRPPRYPKPEDAMRAHTAYLDALSATPRGKGRPEPEEL